MDLIAEEMVVHLPGAIAVELRAAPFVKVDEGHALDSGDISRPLRLGLAHNPALVIVGIARRQRHQDGVGPFLTNLADIASQVGAIRIDGVLLLRTLVKAYIAGIRVDAGDDGTGTLLVEELAIVVMAYRHHDPVAGLQRLADGWPEVCIKGTRRHAAQRLVLDRNLVCIEILGEVVAPAPLAVVAIAQRAVAHRGVAHKKQHRLLSLTCRAWFRTRHQRLGDGVRGIVHYLVHVLNGVRQVVETLRRYGTKG